MKVVVFRTPNGSLSLLHSEGAESIEAELVDGYRVGEGLGGGSSALIFGPLSTPGMTVNEALRASILQVPLFRDRGWP